MIKNLYRLGRALQLDEKLQDYFYPWQNPFPMTDPDKAKVLYFNIVDGIISTPMEIEPFKPKLLKEYLYRKPSGARGAPLVPTDYFYPQKKQEDHQNGVRKLIDRISRAIPDSKSLYFPDTISKKVSLEYVENQLTIFYSDLNKYLITFKVDGNWLGNFAELVQLFENEAYSKYYDKSKAKDQVCGVTYEKVPEVWGRIDTLGFTVNDMTFSRSGFTAEHSYKMFPVSPDAVKILEGAKRYATTLLKKQFYTLNYFIVPHFIETNDQLMQVAVSVVAKALQDDDNTSIEDQSKALFNSERVLGILAEDEQLSSAGVFYDIFFYQENQAQFAIKLHLTDLLPSRFRSIFQAKQKIDRRFARINQIPTEAGPKEFSIRFSMLKNYFASLVKKEVVFKPFFYEILEAVFYGNPIDPMALLQGFNGEIQQTFKQRHDKMINNRYIYRTKEAFAIWHFFLELNLLQNQTSYNMSNQPVTLNLEGFIADHPAFFNEPYKKAAFLMGCLVELLLAAQRKKLNSEPFLEKLSGLNLDEQDLRKLFPVIMEKMQQYHDSIEKFQSKYVQRLRSELVPILIEPSTTNRAEISFAFASGLVMQKEFTREQINAAKNQAASTDQQ